MAVVVRTLSKDDVSETAGRIRREIADHKRHRLAREELRLFRKAMAVAYHHARNIWRIVTGKKPLVLRVMP